MKAVILAGGLGTRISEELHLRPKPMIEIGGKPLLWHIMNIYTAHGVTEFIICLGYRGHMIKEYFANYMLYALRRHHRRAVGRDSPTTRTTPSPGASRWWIPAPRR